MAAEGTAMLALAQESVDNVARVATVVVAAASVLAFLATAYYAWLTRKLAQQATEQSATSREQARVMAEQADVMREQSDVMRGQSAVLREQADSARRAVVAATRPLLVDVPPTGGRLAVPESVLFAGYANPVTISYEGMVVRPAPTPGFVYLSVALRNIGQGPALIVGLGVHASPDVGWSGSMSRAIVAPGESTRVWFSVPTDRPELDDLVASIRGPHRSVTVEVAYTNAAGGDTLRSQLLVHVGGDNEAWVRQVGIVDQASGEVIAMSGAADP